MVSIDQEEINEYLGLYREEYRLVKNARYFGGKLQAEIIPFRYIFTKEDLDYLTATQLHLYLSQLTYVLVARCIKDKEYDLISKQVSIELFVTKMFAGRLFFAGIKERIKSPIYKKDVPISAELSIRSVHRVKNSVFAKISFEIGSNGSVGELLIGVKLD